jgi:rhamnulokinase
MQTAHLAIDLGASSGRAIVGILGGNPVLLELQEVHRFVHPGIPTPNGSVWNLTDIWRNILIGLTKANDYCRAEDLQLTSIGIDSWGVDWALLGASGELLGLPHCYRNPQNPAVCKSVLKKVGGFEQLYRRTGIQYMPINTIFQVAARHAVEPDLFKAARHFVFLPDLFHYWLSGEIIVERTIASTSAMLDVATGAWDQELLEQLGLPKRLFGPIVEPGTKVGTLREELAIQTGSPAQLSIVTPGSHDTASAVAAVPAVDRKKNWAYLSSGTWSLLGVEMAKPNTSIAAAETSFTNERGIGGSIRFLKNISGLWIIQELRRELNRNEEQEYDFEQLMEAAELAESFRTIIDPNREEFLAPGRMAGKIRDFAETTGQPIPETVGDLVRCCLESLALCYSLTLERLEEVTGEPISVLHIVGGGSQNELLNQMTADAIGRNVVCGPTEATAIGNILVQAMGCGKIESLGQLRKIVSNSFEPILLVPTDDHDAWAPAIARFRGLVDPAPAK